MPRPSFAATSLLLTTLTAFGVVVSITRKSIPPPAPNAMAARTEPFLRQGMYQPVKWMTMGDEALAQARREGKPILLLIGSVSHPTARSFDRSVFTDPDIANYLGRHFICVRIDGLREPEWVNAFLPVSRLALGIQPDFQIWALDSRGRVYDYLGRTQEKRSLNAEQFSDSLRRAVRNSGRAVLEAESFWTVQVEDRERLLGLRAGVQQAEGSELAALLAFLTERDRLVRLNGTYQVSPGLIRRLISLEAFDEAERILMSWLATTLYDPIDGTWRAAARDDRVNRTYFDKPVIRNAEMAAVCAIVGHKQQNMVLLAAAENAVDSLLREFGFSAGFTPAILGDEEKTGRSASGSFGRARLDELPTDVREGLLKRFDLADSENPFDLLWLRDPARLLEPDFIDLRRKLQIYRSQPPKKLEERYLYVDALVVARLLQACRYLKSSDRTQTVLARYESLNEYWFQSVLTHRPESDSTERAGLKDYLALADACFEAFLSDGAVRDLNRGRQLLAEVRTEFTGPTDGVLYLGPSFTGKNEVPEIRVPEVVDNGGEAAAAMAVRLFHAYGIGYSDGAMLAAARDIARTSGAAVPIHPQTCTLKVARDTATTSSIVVFGGDRALERAQDEMRRDPNRLCVPGFGPFAGKAGALPVGTYQKTILPEPIAIR